MAEVKPFRGIRYNTSVAGNLGLNVCPPFDMITMAFQEQLYRRSGYNLVRLELARRGLDARDPHASAAETHREWMSSGALVRDEEPSMYVTEESFSFQGRDYVRRGVIAAVRTEEYDRHVVLPHENTLEQWVSDRMRLMTLARFNYSPLLTLFRDDLRNTVTGILRAVAGGKPDAVATPPDMPELRMWQVTDPGTLATLTDTFSDHQLYIADGHHRYEAALRFRSRVRSEREIDPSESLNYRMMMLVSIFEPGLVTRGYHRILEGATGEERAALVSSLRKAAKLTRWEYNGSTIDAVPGLLQELARAPRDGVAFGVYGLEPQKFHVARLPAAPQEANDLERSEYYRLHDVVISPNCTPEREEEILRFFYDPQRAVSVVDSGQSQMVFIMRPMPMEEFMAIVTRGWRLPPKATNFYPKPAAGSVMQALEGPL